ncbi:MAG: TMEM175 family protein, partial [Parasulfuritortus sp.]|nr:TMEM175 family protein [Parasulfuritortus sp.]
MLDRFPDSACRVLTLQDMAGTGVLGRCGWACPAGMLVLFDSQGADMGKNRLEAFSDGVLAIIITIMVLEMKVPHGDSLEALQPLVPVFLSYVLSFVYIGIYWNN